jgi:hypothetical protein
MIIGGSAVSCSPPEIEPQRQEAPPSRSYVVNLPPSIDLDSKVPPLKAEGGDALRVDGLLMRHRSHLETEVSIRGYVVEAAECKARVGQTCPKPYVWIAHTRDEAEQRIRVVDMDRRKQKRIKVGRRYTMRGLYSQTSKSGYADSRGVLRLTSYERVK